MFLLMFKDNVLDGLSWLLLFSGWFGPKICKTPVTEALLKQLIEIKHLNCSNPAKFRTNLLKRS